MKFNELPPKVMAMVYRLCGALNISDLDQFESVEHFLSEVLSRISQAKSLADQAAKVLGG